MIYNQSVFDPWAIESESVQLICTSPPYYALRRYSIPDVIIGGQWMFDKILELYGIGKLTSGFQVTESVAPQLNRKTLSKKILDVLTPEHKTFSDAGNAEGSRLTPFTRTCADIVKEVKANPGITIKELVQTVKTHYATPATARVCITKWIGTKHIDVRFEKVGKTLKLYPNP